MDFFALFQLKPSFQQDEAAIQSQYYLLQQKAHPDNFVNAPLSEKQAAQQSSALINEAYRTLKDPYRRALYLLKQRGIDLLKETQTALPQDILIQQLELREALDELKQAGQTESLKKLKQQNATDLQSLENSLRHLSDDRSLDEVKRLLWQIGFYRKLQEELI